MFEDKRIGVDDAKALAAALQGNTSVTSIDLDCKELGRRLFGLSQQSSIDDRFRWVKDNRIGDVGAAALAGALASNKSVTSINLSCKRCRCGAFFDGAFPAVIQLCSRNSQRNRRRRRQSVGRLAVAQHDFDERRLGP